MKISNSTHLDRRAFLSGSLALLSLSAIPGCHQLGQNEQWLVSACSNKDGEYFATAVNQAGEIISRVALPSRGHDSLAMPHKPGHALVFARRPDNFALEIDFKNGRIVHAIESDSDSHFFGHGALSQDGKYLYTTENRFDKGHGMIVVRDTQNYQVIERFHSGGIGPHELAMMPDGKTLVIANGGILTHPDRPRLKLNVPTMRPNLAYMDAPSGTILSRFEPPNHQQSLRHLTVRKDGKVFVGAQYQGNKGHIVPLIYAHNSEDTLREFSAGEQQWRNMNQYTASLLSKGNILAVSCPRGGYITFWDANEHVCLEQVPFTDVAGLTQLSNQMIASSGNGQAQKFNLQPSSWQDPAHFVTANSSDVRFDNHMTTINTA
jgi:hypothetical protein